MDDDQKLKLKREVIDKNHEVKGLDREWLINLIKTWENGRSEIKDDTQRSNDPLSSQNSGPEDL